MSSSAGVQTCALRSEEHTSELQSLTNLVCRLLLETKRAEVAQALGGVHGLSERVVHEAAGQRAELRDIALLRRELRRCVELLGFFFLIGPPPPHPSFPPSPSPFPF